MDNLESVLVAHQDVFDAAKGSLAGLPEKRGGLPLTFTEATAYIQHKEDEKRRREAKKDRQKQRSGPPVAETIPGLLPGPPDTSPFWLVTEVNALTALIYILLLTMYTLGTLPVQKSTEACPNTQNLIGIDSTERRHRQAALDSNYFGA